MSRSLGDLYAHEVGVSPEPILNTYMLGERDLFLVSPAVLHCNMSCCAVLHCNPPRCAIAWRTTPRHAHECACSGPIPLLPCSCWPRMGCGTSWATSRRPTLWRGAPGAAGVFCCSPGAAAWLPACLPACDPKCYVASFMSYQQRRCRGPFTHKQVQEPAGRACELRRGPHTRGPGAVEGAAQRGEQLAHHSSNDHAVCSLLGV